MTPRTTLDKVVEELRHVPVPFVFFDACAIVDIVRFGRSDREVELATIEAAQRLIRAAERRTVRLLGTELLSLEVQGHLTNEQAATAVELDRLSRQVVTLLEGLDLRVGAGNASTWRGIEVGFVVSRRICVASQIR